ncbi:MAG: nucleotidyl transferase AbiEii/AbiGii toxin family protein [Halomonadaceae bacterium]|nr:MAG: nucleotidyl transferase AbiEii/AbiGii toxin family protein [Halomonadaceae bacterium]
MLAICEVIHEEGKPLVLKGGTALLLGYQLERFSEDLDFDLTIVLKGHLNIESICRSATKKLAGRGIKLTLDTFNELKKTATTHRCRPMFSVGDENAPPISIKIEISSRSTPDPECIRTISGIKVYAVSEIARLKLLAASEDETRRYRTAARDLHDLAFIASHWDGELAAAVIDQLEAFFSDPAYLMERYADAYEDDGILNGHLFEDLNTIERWMEDRNDDDALNLISPD